MQRGVIKIERFIDKKNIKHDFYIVCFFVILFCAFGIIEKNLFLSGEGLGLLEHINIWIFLTINFTIPLVINKIFSVLRENIDDTSYNELNVSFANNATLKLVAIFSNFIKTIGFCCFVGNSLQNAHIINQLPFDFWDSNNYVLSFIASRMYKFYLFAYFIPTLLTYVFILIKSISEILTIKECDMEEYPIKNYMQLNTLCNFGLDILLIILVPFVILTSGVYWVHSRLDITTITTICIAFLCTLSFLGMYSLLIRNYYTSVIKYKKKHIKQINLELSKIHQYICQSPLNEASGELLEVYLKKETYLWQSKKRINKISKFPLVIKAIVTSISPFVPALTKVAQLAFKSFF